MTLMQARVVFCPGPEFALVLRALHGGHSQQSITAASTDDPGGPAAHRHHDRGLSGGGLV